MNKQPLSFNDKSRRKNLVKLVNQGYALHLQIVTLTEELKAIKDTLKAEALSHPAERFPLSDTSREGLQWIASGNGCACHIVFPAPRLISEVSVTHRDLPILKNLAGTHFPDLFEEVTSFHLRDRSHFREHVAERLSPLTSTHLIELCSLPSEPKAIWKGAAL